MPRSRAFTQVDVFGTRPYSGNPLAVVLDGEGIDDDLLQDVARWTNLSETTFVLPPTTPEADYRVRIMTPGGELPFAGHPTLGTAHAWLVHGGTPRREDRSVQECGAGLVDVLREGSGLAFTAPPLVRTGPLDDADLDRLVAALGMTRADVAGHQWVDNGPGWAALRLPSAEHVRDLRPDWSHAPDAKVGSSAGTRTAASTSTRRGPSSPASASARTPSPGASTPASPSGSWPKGRPRTAGR